MNKTIINELNDTIVVILIDALAGASEASDTTKKLVLLSTTKIMEHVEKALEAAYDKGRSEGYEDGYLECEQGYSERESYD